jgi:hypothetical protein
MSEFNALVFRKFRYVAIAALCVLDSCKSPPKVENPSQDRQSAALYVSLL